MDKKQRQIPTRIETERLYLRCYVEADSAWYYGMALRNRSHLARYESRNLTRWIKTLEDASFQVDEHMERWKQRTDFVLGAFKKETDQFVAEITVIADDLSIPDFWIGYFADVYYQGQGYVTEAVKATIAFCFAHLRAYRLTVSCDNTNHRSRRVAERCGMVLEEHSRQYICKQDGSLSSTLNFCLLRSEYLRIKKSINN